MTKKDACCGASRGGRPQPDHQVIAQQRSFEDFETVLIPSGRGLVGTSAPQIADDGEGPLREVRQKAFRIGVCAVSNAEFEAFVAATGYVTEAERFGWSFVFWSDVPAASGPTEAYADAQWWRRVDGANWRDINGPGTNALAWHPAHPVVQVSWHDAQAYARWAGGRLPSEIEWEVAARGGLGDVRFPWGDAEPEDDDFTPCNIWQGRFPQMNTVADGFRHTAPVRSFEPNGFGLFNMAGNVWEWTADAFRIKSMKKQVRHRMAGMKGYRLSKGGSYLCHKSYCYRYRIAARSGSSPDSATPHHGFRLIWSV